MTDAPSTAPDNPLVEAVRKAHREYGYASFHSGPDTSRSGKAEEAFEVALRALSKELVEAKQEPRGAAMANVQDAERSQFTEHRKPSGTQGTDPALNALDLRAATPAVWRQLEAAEQHLADAERKIKGYQADMRETEQILGQALGYPWYKDDQKNFPGTTEADGVCVGEHVGPSIAAEAAKRLADALQERDEMKDALVAYRETLLVETKEEGMGAGKMFLWWTAGKDQKYGLHVAGNSYGEAALNQILGCQQMADAALARHARS